MAYGLGTIIPLLPFGITPQGIVANATMIIDADGEETAIKYFPQTTSPITDIDLCLEVTGDTSGINLRIRVESDSADAPSGTILGATNNAITAEFTHSTDGFTGLKALAESTGNLTLNVPVWIIVYRSSGSSLSGSIYLSQRGMGFASAFVLPRARLYTGGNWTGTTASTTRIGYVVKHADETYNGLPYISGQASSASATDLYGTYRHGVRMKYGSQIKFVGFLWVATKTGSPNALVATVYEGSVSKYSQTIPAASIVTAVSCHFWFSSPVLLAADTNLYLILQQESNGGDNSNDYDSKVATMSETYRAAGLAPDMAFVYGTGDDPTALTVSNTEVPHIIPLIVDPASDLDQAAGGGRPELRGPNL